MAIELGLNRYIARPPEWETELQRLERRNRERTYLVLFVHDRSLSMQTGRQWMLSEDEIVLKSEGWHECVPRQIGIRPEDVILASMVSLRRIAVRNFPNTKLANRIHTSLLRRLQSRNSSKACTRQIRRTRTLLQTALC